MSSIHEIIAARDIGEVLHFTTNSGVAGVFASRALKARTLLDVDKYLERVFTPNAHTRRDPSWAGYVSMSISEINNEFFSYAEGWHAHEDLWWAILSFDAEILSHDGVWFTTTNNIYTGVHRTQGPEGLTALFADRIHRYANVHVDRSPQAPPHLPTCVQAEVLYPREVPTSFLRRVYVVDSENAGVIEAQAAALAHPPVDVIIDTDRFA